MTPSPARQPSTRAARATVAALILALACDLPTEADWPQKAQPWRPPAHFAYWWSQVEQCAGLTADMADVQWFVQPGWDPIRIDGVDYDGYWWPNGNRILLTGQSALNQWTVRHEMLHALLQTGRHMPRYFRDSCEGVVHCRGECGSALGFPPELLRRAVEVDPEHLRVSVEAQRPPASFGLTDRWLTFTVRAENTSSRPVWVRLRSPFLLGYVVDAPGDAGTYLSTPESRVFFAPGQERQLVADHEFMTSGTFGVWGLFNNVSSPRVSVEVEP